MLLLHCSDLHLDASMRSRFDAETAGRRRAEMLHTFGKMAAWASSHAVRAILLCGDLFDTEAPSAVAVSAVEAVIKEYPHLLFFYLRGNHDSSCPLFAGRQLPENLHLFDSGWQTFEIGENVCITGREMSGEITENAQMRPAENSGRTAGSADTEGLLPFAPPSLGPGKINIVMLHGQICDGYRQRDGESIPLGALRGRGIDYLALGHLHTYREIPLDQRGTAVYPGCLEGRGFDECGEKGFVLVKIDEDTGIISHEFVPFASRRLFEISCDVTDLRNTSEISAHIEDQLRDKAALRTSDMIRIVLTGGLDENCVLNLEYLRQEWEDRFFYFEIRDRTKPLVHVEDYLGDATLKGEFVRTVCTACGAEEISTDLRDEILRCGLRALAGETFLQ